MTNFEFGAEKRLSRLTAYRVEPLNALFTEIAEAFTTKVEFTIDGDLDLGGGRAINAADGVDPQDFVTKAQLDATAFSPALPGQTGNAGKFITTNGSAASWVDAPVRFDLAQLLSDPQKAQARSNIAAAGSTETTAALALKANASDVTAALATKAEASAVAVALDDLSDLVAERVKFLATGVALPTSDIGPIWHADYASIMTWQVFSANGASYTGYASVEIGRPSLDGQSTARAGYLKRNGASLSKTTYAALWNWALHAGRVVTLGSWTASPYVFADNGDGTFKLPDNRGEFERIWDDGRGVNSGRAFGSYQADAFQGHLHENADWENIGGGVGMSGSAFSVTTTSTSGPISDGTNGTPRTASETRSRSVALLGDIKF